MSKRKFSVDISERQQAEQAQRSMDELFQVLIENALDVITIIDAEGVIRYESPSVERVLGYKPAELIGVNMVELLHPEDVPKVNAAIKALAPPNGTPGIAQVVEARFRHKDGSWRLLEGIGKTLPGGLPVTGIVINSRDITERKRAEEEIRQRNRELAALNAIAIVVSQSLNLDEILNAALDKVLELVHLDVGGIFLADPGHRQLDLVAHRGISKEFAHEIESINVDEKTLEAVMAEGKLGRFILSAKAVMKDRVELQRIVSAMRKEGLSLASAAPVLLQAKEEVVGLMIVASRAPQLFSEAELQLLTSIGQQITIAVQNARLYEQIRDRVAELASLNLASQTITASLDLQRVLSQVVDLASGVVNAAYTSVVLLMEDGSMGLSAENFREEPPIQVRARPQGITHQIIASRQPMVFDEVLDDSTHNPALVATGVRSYAGLPLMAKEKVLGVLFVHSHAPGAFRNRLPLLTTFANQAAIAIENARLYDAVQYELAERKRAEEALRESEEKYRTLIERANDGIAIVQDTIVKYVNPSLAEVAGYTTEELIGTPFADYFHPGDLHIVVDRYKRRMAGEDVTPVYEIAVKRKDGSKVYIEVNAGIITYQGKPAELVVVRDLTARKRAEEALRESERRFRALIENSQDIITLVGADGTLLYDSPAITRVLGYAPEERVGRKVFEFIHSDDRQAFRESFEAFVQQPGAVETTQGRFRHKDGSWRWIEGIRNNLLAEPSVQAIVVNYRDVTERIQRERELQAVVTVTAALRVAPTRAEMLPVILDQLLDLLKAGGATLAIRDLVSGETVIELGRGDWATWTGVCLPPGEGVSGHVIATGKPYVHDDVQSDRRMTHLDLLGGLHCVACVPLITQEQTIGALWVGRKTAILENEVRLLTAISDMAANAIHRATLHEQTEQRLRQIQALRTIDMAITASFDVRVTLNVILDQATTYLGIDAVAILLLDPHFHTLEYAANRGFRTAALQHTHLRLGEGHAGLAALERRLVAIADLRSQIADLAAGQSAIPNLQSAIQAEGFIAYYAAPLISKGHVRGVLEIFHRAPLYPDQAWLDSVQALAAQAAIAIDNASLFDDLQHSNFELTLAYDTTLEGWSRTLELHDYETEGHSQRVTEMTKRLARAMGISEQEVVHMQRGALLHDIGKMGIPDAILLKPDKLTDKEWAIMHKHPIYAHELLLPITYLHPALDIPYCHHEKWDGTGYPRGLKGELIPLAARIFAIVDVYDALTSDRPYRKAWTKKKALKYIREQSGKHFDPKVEELFLRVVIKKTEEP